MSETMKVARSARTGRFVSMAAAQEDPDTTVVEEVPTKDAQKKKADRLEKALEEAMFPLSLWANGAQEWPSRLVLNTVYRIIEDALRHDERRAEE